MSVISELVEEACQMYLEVSRPHVTIYMADQVTRRRAHVVPLSFNSLLTNPFLCSLTLVPIFFGIVSSTRRVVLSTLSFSRKVLSMLFCKMHENSSTRRIGTSKQVSLIAEVISYMVLQALGKVSFHTFLDAQLTRSKLLRSMLWLVNLV